MFIFFIILGYMIVKFHAFHLKTFATQVLVVGLVFLVSSLLFLGDIASVRLITSITLIFVIITGFLLIKSVKKEVEQREQLQKISEELFEANDKLKGLDKLKTEFLSLASHQLRSPLTAIKGYTSMLLAGDFGTVNDKQKETIDRVFESSKHLTRVVEDLLSVTKIEQGGMQYAMQPFDFEKAASDLAKDLAITAEKKGLKLTFETDNKAPYTVNGDMEKIRQVVLNLLDNSIKYTPTGSIEVRVTKNENTKKILWSAKDTGMGIKPEILGTLFGKFSRGEGNKLNTTGSGLGLYLAKMIVDAHKGRVWAESDGEGKGSTFFIELDAA
jgi:signal transduction histidine kinase